jgi:putative FmdB family regulatory protein
MPIYEFRCRQCGHRFEELCRMGSNGAGVRCPGCKGKRVERIMSRFASRSSGRDRGLEASSAGGSACSTCTASSCATCK